MQQHGTEVRNRTPYRTREVTATALSQNRNKKYTKKSRQLNMLRYPCLGGMIGVSLRQGSRYDGHFGAHFLFGRIYSACGIRPVQDKRHMQMVLFLAGLKVISC